MVHKQTYTINEFCFEHNIGRTTFYELLNEGKAPSIMKIGRRTLISIEAAKQWREEFTKQQNAQKAILKGGE